MEKKQNKTLTPAKVPENWKFSDERIEQAWQEKSAQFVEFKEIFDKKFNE